MVNKPWKDWPDTDIEAGNWVKAGQLMNGYNDGTFRPNEKLFPSQFINVLTRAGLLHYPVTGLNGPTVGDALKMLPNTTKTAKPTEPLTRYKLAVMLYRHFAPTDDWVIYKLDKWFEQPHDGHIPRLSGHATTVVKASRQHNIPLWLALGQCWRESCFFTGGLSLTYNLGWGLKEHNLRFGAAGTPPVVQGFANFRDVDECIWAYFRLMDSPERQYRKLIDAGYYQEALNIYAPASENDTAEHWRIVQTVKRWCEQRGIK